MFAITFLPRSVHRPLKPLVASRGSYGIAAEYNSGAHVILRRIDPRILRTSSAPLRALSVLDERMDSVASKPGTPSAAGFEVAAINYRLNAVALLFSQKMQARQQNRWAGI